MRNAANIAGLVGAALVLVVPAALFIAGMRAGTAALLLWVIVPTVMGCAALSVAVMALAAVSYSETRPSLSARLYFVATGVGLLVLWITGAFLTSPTRAYLFMLPVVPLPIAGVLMHKSRNQPIVSAAAGGQGVR